MISKIDAIHSLRPDTEWVMSGDDVEGITWHTPDVVPLTQAEVDAEVLRLEAEEIVQSAATQAATAAAIAHAKSLGFTDEMVAIMYPNLIEVAS